MSNSLASTKTSEAMLDNPKKAPYTQRLTRRNDAWPMPIYLAVLVAFVLAPQVALSALIGWKYANESSRSVEQSTQTVALAFSETLDRYLDGSVAAIQTLATTDDFSDLRTLDARARQIVPLRGTAISMRDRTGQQLLNTVVPFGTALPRTASDAVKQADEQVFETGKPIFSNIYKGTVADRWFFIIDLPVERNGTRQFALNIAISSEDLRQAMFHGLPAGWTAAVLDQTQRVMARALDQDKFLGQPATGDLVAMVRQQVSGTLESTTLAGTSVFTAFARSPLSGYTVVVSAPRAVLDQPTRDLWTYLAASLGLSLVLSVCAAWLWSRRATSALMALEASASASWDGLAEPIATPIRELNSLSISITRAANLIREKTARQDRLIAELNHRVKNTLAILQAVTIGTVHSKSSRDLGEALRFRIHGLSAAHDLLNAHDWDDVRLDRLVQAVASFTGHSVDRVEGPTVVLCPKAVVSLCQVFTELCEAAKLCNVLASSVDWELEDSDILVTWIGLCAPDAFARSDPFSLRIIHLCVERQLGGTFEFQEYHHGWSWRCSIPLTSELGPNATPLKA